MLLSSCCYSDGRGEIFDNFREIHRAIVHRHSKYHYRASAAKVAFTREVISLTLPLSCFGIFCMHSSTLSEAWAKDTLPALMPLGPQLSMIRSRDLRLRYVGTFQRSQADPPKTATYFRLPHSCCSNDLWFQHSVVWPRNAVKMIHTIARYYNTTDAPLRVCGFKANRSGHKPEGFVDT